MKHANKLTKDIFFITTTVVDWVDIFTRPIYKHIIIDSLRYCQKEKGLEIYAWALMSNHLHLIAGAKEGFLLSDIIRDFKRHTSKLITKTIETENESRKEWMLNRFEFAGKNDNKIKYYKFWQEGYDEISLFFVEVFNEKLNYIHNNPVKAEIVTEPHHYLYSSAINYASGKGLIDVQFI